MEVCWHAMALSRDYLPMRAVAGIEDRDTIIAIGAIVLISAAAVPLRLQNRGLD